MRWLRPLLRAGGRGGIKSEAIGAIRTFGASYSPVGPCRGSGEKLVDVVDFLSLGQVAKFAQSEELEESLCGDVKSIAT